VTLADQTLSSASTTEITESISIVPDRSIDLDQPRRTSHNDPETMRQLLALFDLQAGSAIGCAQCNPLPVSLCLCPNGYGCV
jgi:hypothetical protein